MAARVKRTVVVIVVALGIVAGTSTMASASFGIGIAPNGAIEGTSEGRLVFRGGAGVEISCEVVLRGNLVPLVRKLVGQPFGAIAGGEARGCVGNMFTIGVPTVMFLAPIPLTYNSFLGTLPNITGLLVNFQPLNFRTNETEARARILAECLYEGTIGGLLTVAGGEFDRLRFLEANRARLKAERSRGVENCEAEMVLRGSLRIAPRQRAVLLLRDPEVRLL